jgi:hypothetical protein
VTNVVNALTLIIETVRVIKVHPAIVLALINVSWRTTSAFVVWDIYGCWFSLRNNEGVVHHDILRGAEILPSMDMAIQFLESLLCGKCFFPTTSVLNRQRTAFYDVEDLARVIMPGSTSPGFKVIVRTVAMAGPSKRSECGIVPTARMKVTAEYTVIPMRRTPTPITVTTALRVLSFMFGSPLGFEFGSFASGACSKTTNCEY